MVAPFPDLSNYQAGSNVAAILTALGSDRALYKATEGKGYKASTFPVFVAATLALNKKVGAYHFARPSQSDGTTEASWHAAVIRTAGFSPSNMNNHWTCYDFEDPDLNQTVASNRILARSHAINFCNTMVTLGWTSGVIYGSYPYLNWAGLTAAMLPSGWRQLHIANYGQTPDDQVTLPNGWSRSQVVARQYTSTATVPGATTKIDVSHFDREWLGVQNGESVGFADDQLQKLNNQFPGLNPSEFSTAFATAVSIVRGLRDPHQGIPTADQVGLVGQNVTAARQDIAALAQALATGGGVPAPTLDYDLLAGKVVDALVARLMAGAPQPAANTRLVWNGVTTADDLDKGSVYADLQRDPRFAPRTPSTPPPGEEPIMEPLTGGPMVECMRDARVCPNPVDVTELGSKEQQFICGCPPVQGPDNS